MVLFGNISTSFDDGFELTLGTDKLTLHHFGVCTMAKNGAKWPKVAQSGPKWPKWHKVAQNGNKTLPYFLLKYSKKYEDPQTLALERRPRSSKHFSICNDEFSSFFFKFAHAGG